jgi:hypothetical protein
LAAEDPLRLVIVPALLRIDAPAIPREEWGDDGGDSRCDAHGMVGHLEGGVRPSYQQIT